MVRRGSGVQISSTAPGIYMHRKPIVIIDFDSTLVRVESLDELARLALSTHPERKKILAVLEGITKQGMAGELAFDESLDRRLRLFRANKQHVNQLVEALRGQLSLSALANAQWFKHNSDRIYVVSGGFKEYIIPTLGALGIHPTHIFANSFLYDERDVIAGYDSNNLLCRAKGKVAQVAALNLPRPVVMVGDGYSDYEVFKAGEANKFWAFTESIYRPTVAAKASKVLTSFDDLVEAVT